MRPLLYPLLVVLSQLATMSAFPQAGNLKFEHLGTDAGLSQGNVKCVLRDSRGFMWFGTREGLNKYDGYGFVVYKNVIEDTLSISGNDITGLVEDQAGDLWITTSGGGLNRFDRSKNRFIHYKGVIPADLISGPMLDDSGRIWVGSTEGGVFVLEPATGKIVSFSNDPKNARSLSDNNITAICEDSHQQMWIGTLRGGLNLYDRSCHSFTRYQHRNKDSTSLGGTTVAAVFEDGHHRLWVGLRDDGLDVFDPIHRSFRHFRHNPNNSNSLASNVVLSLEDDVNGNLWVGTENGGISILDPETKIFTRLRP